MSIYAVTGVPGSGKSYFSVYDIYEKLKTKDEFLILTNIEGLKTDDSRVIVCEWKNGSWFSNRNQELGIKKLREDYSLSSDAKIYYYIDESQRFFPPELKDNDIVYFFDYHRHYGLEIYLITQSVWKISKKISTLVELEYRAVNNRINPLPRFTYKVLAGGEQFKTVTRKKEKAVFALYQSFQAGSKDKKDMSLAVAVCIGIVLFGLGWYGFRHVFADSLGARVQREKARGMTDTGLVSQDGSLSSRESPLDRLDDIRRGVEGEKIDEFGSVSYMGPEIKTIKSGQIVLEDDTGFDVMLAFDRFVDKYPPDVYGYSYVAWDDKFIMYDRGTNEILYPCKRKVYRTTVQKIKYDKDLERDQENKVLDKNDDNQGGAFAEDSALEYKRQQREIINRFHQVS
jgi:hypothetical protein